MKRHTILTVLAAVLTASGVLAGQFKDFEIAAVTPDPTNASVTVTAKIGFDCWLDDLYVDMVTAGSTSDVAVTVRPAASTVAAVSLLSQSAVTADAWYRPRFYPTIGGGVTTYTNGLNPTIRLPILSDDVISMTLTNGTSSNRVYRVVLRVERSK